MDCVGRQANGAHVRVLLTEDELQLSAIDDLCNKYHDWLKLSKEATGGRKTRSANRRVDTIYEEIMAFKVPPIKIRAAPVTPPPSIKTIIQGISNNNSTKSSIDGDNSESSSANSSERTGRTLRPRCRTPSVSRQQASPATPTHQNIRAHMKKTPDSNTNSANVLSAALNQQHPLVSVTKIRQLLRADSAQKKREEEKERQELVRVQRKAKEERAEAQKRQLLEERAVTAKFKREQRLLHAAEVRKARERARIEQKLKEEQTRKPHQNHNHGTETFENNHTQVNQHVPNNHTDTQKLKEKQKAKESSPERTHKNKDSEIVVLKQTAAPAPIVAKELNGNLEQPTKQAQKPRKMDETFQKPADEIHNIEISLCDETTEEQKKQPAVIASWAKAPGLRDVVVAQFSQPEEVLLKQALNLFRGVKLPVRLDEIFGPNEAVNNRYLCRTSSAVWTTPHKPLKRTSSDVLTPKDSKRPA